MGQPGNAEVLGHRGAEIGKGAPDAEISTGPDSRAGHEQRHVLAGVVGRAGGGIVAVVGGEEEQIVLPEQSPDGGKRSVEVKGTKGPKPHKAHKSRPKRGSR